MPKITVYFLQASRSIRPVWLLEELGIPYEVEFADRQGNKAPQEFKVNSPTGRFPTIKDGDLVVAESGAIVEYLCEKYDTAHRMVPENPHTRTQVQQWVHAAEGTLMMHGLPCLYVRWFAPESAKESGAVEEMVEKLSANVQKNLDWVERTLDASTGGFLVGNSVTAADIMVKFSVDFILARELGTGGKKWPKIEAWIKRCEELESYKRAVEKSGHTLYPKTS